MVSQEFEKRVMSKSLPEIQGLVRAANAAWHITFDRMVEDLGRGINHFRFDDAIGRRLIAQGRMHMLLIEAHFEIKRGMIYGKQR